MDERDDLNEERLQRVDTFGPDNKADWRANCEAASRNDCTVRHLSLEHHLQIDSAVISSGAIILRP